MLANQKLASKAFKSNNPIEMHTNLGHEILDVEAELPGFGDVCLHKEGLANTFGLVDLKFRKVAESCSTQMLKMPLQCVVLIRNWEANLCEPRMVCVQWSMVEVNLRTLKMKRMKVIIIMMKEFRPNDLNLYRTGNQKQTHFLRNLQI